MFCGRSPLGYIYKGNTMKKLNEKNALESAIMIYRNHKNIVEKEQHTRYPDEENRNSKDIDCITSILNQRIAIEHSILEYYEGQIEYTYSSYDIVENINNKLSGKIPKDRYYLALIQPALIIGKSKKSIDELSNEIYKSILEKQNELLPNEKIEISHDNEKVIIYCENEEGPEKGNLHRAPTIPEHDIDKLARKRIKRLVNEKVVKLIKYKLLGYKTIFVIEDISGRHMFGIKENKIGLKQRILIRLFIDMGIVMVSNKKRMIVGNIWKSGSKWYNEIPYKNRYKLS